MKNLKRIIAWMCVITLVLGLFIKTPEARAAENETIGKVTVFIENTILSEKDGAAWTGSYSAEIAFTESDTMLSILEKAGEAVGKDIQVREGEYGPYLYAIGGLEEKTGSDWAGFVGTINDWGPDYGFASIGVKTKNNPYGYIKDGDVLKIMYSLDGGNDVGVLYSSEAVLSGISSPRGSLDAAFSADTTSYTLTFPKGTEKAAIIAKPANSYYQSRIYINEYAPKKEGYDAYNDSAAHKFGDLISVSDGDVIYIGVADPSWPGSVSWYEETPGNWKSFSPESVVYEVKIAVSNEAAKVENMDDIYKETGKALLASTEPVYGNEMAVFTLARAGLIDKAAAQKYYDSVKALVKEKGAKLSEKASTENSKVILTLTALGFDPENVEGVNLLEPLSDMEYVDSGFFSGPVYALLAADSGDYDIPRTRSGKQADRNSLIDAALAYQMSDGGFAWAGADGGDIDTTSMVIPALIPYMDKNEKAKKAVEDALAFLSSAQNEDGSYASWGAVNAETEATVSIALSILNRDSQTDPEFSKNGYGLLENICLFYLGNGEFEHVKDGGANAYASYQAYQALVAYYRMKNGERSFFDVKDKEKKPEKSTDDKATPGETSPKTGDGAGLTFAAVAAFAALSLAVVTKKKENSI